MKNKLLTLLDHCGVVSAALPPHNEERSDSVIIPDCLLSALHEPIRL